jgi:EpsI family protein
MAFENLPLQLDEFSGNNIYLYDEIAKYESADNWILRSYTGSKQDIAILVFVGYWENQNENKLIVSPRYVSGAQSFLKKKTMKNSHNNDLVLNEFLMDGKQGKELIYYCFFMDGKVIPDDYQFRFKRMVNSLLYRRNNAALLRVSTPITNDFPVEDAELYIEDFLKDFLPIVKEFLPR